MRLPNTQFYIRLKCYVDGNLSFFNLNHNQDEYSNILCEKSNTCLYSSNCVCDMRLCKGLASVVEDGDACALCVLHVT